MNIKEIFNVFSRRHKDEHLKNLTLPEEFRTRVSILVRERFGNTPHGNYVAALLEEIHLKFSVLLGKNGCCYYEKQNEQISWRRYERKKSYKEYSSILYQ